eukprot:Phypoly_transcript_02990.p1 GENE.Phypoly_transcript_02990~~Phypoly_transcript_02990.p1  ORF type:complete len:792 (+),score=81.78 Phypoly_transcript_02990:69-2444(+)
MLAFSRLCAAIFAIRFPSSSTNNSLQFQAIVLQVPLLLKCWIIRLTCRSYFGNELLRRDPKNNVNEISPLLKWKTRMQVNKTERGDSILAYKQFSNEGTTLPRRAGLQKIEFLCLLVLTVAYFSQAVFLYFSPTTPLTSPTASPTTFPTTSPTISPTSPTTSSTSTLSSTPTPSSTPSPTPSPTVHQYYMYYSGWNIIILRAFYVVIKVAQMQSLAHMGVFFSKIHSNGLAWFLMLFGFLLDLLVDTVLQILSLNFTSDELQQLYSFLGREIITEFLPYTFHIFNVFQLHRFSRYQNRSSSIDSPTRIKLLSYTIVVLLHVVGFGHTLAYFHIESDTRFSFFAPRAAGVIATIDLSYVALAFCSPFVQFLTYFFNITHHTPHNKLQFHSNMAWSAAIFSTIHVAFHVFNWIHPTTEPHQCNDGKAVTTTIYQPGSISFITGIIMLTCFCGALITGYMMTRKHSHMVFFSFHVPLACVGFIAFFLHGNQGCLGDALASSWCQGVFMVSISVAIFFFIFARPRELEVDRHSEFGKKFVLLSVKYLYSQHVPPGAFFNIYGSTDSYVSIFHCHSFPVMSTRNSRITFLIQCCEGTGTRSSFTSRLSRDKPSSIRVQGPFKGPASSFLLSLNSPKNNKTPKCMFLCGLTGGFASVFSLLEYFKENIQTHNLQSVTCMFLKISEDNVRAELHMYVYNLVQEWDAEIPLTLIETDDKLSLKILQESYAELVQPGVRITRVQELFPHCQIWLAEKNSENGIVERRRLGIVDKAMYFCGNDFQHELFPEPQWQVFVESC